MPRDASALAEPAGDVAFRALVPRGSEDVTPGAGLDELAHEQEGSRVGHAGCLLHAVRHDEDRVVCFSVCRDSSTFAVLIGSSPEVGSSRRITSGSKRQRRAPG